MGSVTRWGAYDSGNHTGIRSSLNLLDRIQMVKVHLSPQWSLQGISIDFPPGLGTSI